MAFHNQCRMYRLLHKVYCSLGNAALQEQAVQLVAAARQLEETGDTAAGVRMWLYTAAEVHIAVEPVAQSALERAPPGYLDAVDAPVHPQH